MYAHGERQQLLSPRLVKLHAFNWAVDLSQGRRSTRPISALPGNTFKRSDLSFCFVFVALHIVVQRVSTCTVMSFLF